ncbi:MAG: anaerobic ribonucleoside-triphosphate reductase, partial [Candidatus Sericytochromatia bacterium]
QDAIEKVLIAEGHARTAKAFILYRARRSRIREGRTELMDTVAEILQAESGHAGLPPARLHAIGLAASREYYLNRFLPEAIADAHLQGDLHIHGLAHYAKSPQAFVLPYRRLLEGGFTTGHAYLRPPRRAASAAALTALMLQAAHLDCHGGLVIADFDGDLAATLPADTPEASLAQAMEALVHQLNATPSPTAGEPPRVTLHVGLAESPLGQAVARALLQAVERGLGRGEVAMRPLVVFRVRTDLHLAEGAPLASLARRAAEVAAKTPAVTFAFEAEAASAGFEGRLTGHGGAAGVTQIAKTTINLPRVALQARRAGGDIESALDTAVEAAKTQLLHRYEALASRAIAEFPFLMGQGLHRGADGLKPTDPVGEALAAGTLSIGLIGLAEALVVLTGSHHGESEESQALGMRIVEHLAAHATRLSAETGLRFVLGATDAAGLGDRLARLDRRAFGMIKGATETPHYTSGVCVPADAAIDHDQRLAREGAYAPMLEGGSFSQLPLTEAPTPEAAIAWLAFAAAAGVRMLALDYPLAHCQACGGAGLPEASCPSCDGPASMLRRVQRRRGYLPLEA